MKSLILITLLFLVPSFGSACGTETTGPPQRDIGVDILFPDATVDIQIPDTGLADTTPDTTPDATVADTTSDTVADTTPDPDTTVADTVADTTPDTVADTTPDTVADTTDADTVADTTPDTVADTTPDTVADTTPDTVADTTPDPDTTPECQQGGCVTDITKLGNTCATAYVIGRPNAQTGFGHLGSTVGAGNNSDFPQAACGDSGPDRFYKIYLKAGEQLWVNANPSPATYDLTFGLYVDESCATPFTCVDNDLNGTTPDSFPFQAIDEGWHVLVVDGRATQGDYSLVVTLDCQEDDCCCP